MHCTCTAHALHMQALLLHPDPRLLVCAPSNAAADVLALRLLEQLPHLAARMQATRDADLELDRWCEHSPCRWWQDETTGDVSTSWTSGSGWSRILRLNAQQRVGTPVELMKVCAQDPHSDHFTVPGARALALKRVVRESMHTACTHTRACPYARHR